MFPKCQKSLEDRRLWMGRGHICSLVFSISAWCKASAASQWMRVDLVRMKKGRLALGGAFTMWSLDLHINIYSDHIPLGWAWNTAFPVAVTPVVTMIIPQDSVKERESEPERIVIFFFPYFPSLSNSLFCLKEMPTEKYKPNRQGRLGRFCLFSKCWLLRLHQATWRCALSQATSRDTVGCLSRTCPSSLPPS